MTYRAIGFDWGGVLYGEPGQPLYMQIIDLLGISLDEYNTAYFRHNNKANSGEISYEELWTLVLQDLGQTDKLSEVLALNAASMAKVPNAQMLALVKTLRANGYKVGMLSNNSVERGDMLRSEGLDKEFDVFHISAETGLAKPDPASFRLFADALGVALDELIFIDDTPQSLSTAPECGYAPILFKNYSELIENLAALGIEIPLEN